MMLRISEQAFLEYFSVSRYLRLVAKKNSQEAQKILNKYFSIA
jgi:hypothetical protein